MCDPSRDTQKWSFEKYDAQRLAKWDQAGPGLQLLDLPSLSFFRSIVRKSLIPIVKKKEKKKSRQWASSLVLQESVRPVELFLTLKLT